MTTSLEAREVLILMIRVEEKNKNTKHVHTKKIKMVDWYFQLMLTRMQKGSNVF